MLELDTAISLGKPVVVLFTERVWGHNSWVTPDMRNKLGLNDQVIGFLTAVIFAKNLDGEAFRAFFNPNR